MKDLSPDGSTLTPKPGRSESKTIFSRSVGIMSTTRFVRRVELRFGIATPFAEANWKHMEAYLGKHCQTPRTDAVRFWRGIKPQIIQCEILGIRRKETDLRLWIWMSRVRIPSLAPTIAIVYRIGMK